MVVIKLKSELHWFTVEEVRYRQILITGNKSYMVYSKILDRYSYLTDEEVIDLAVENILKDFDLEDILDENSTITINENCIKSQLQYAAANKILES